ncbi:MAG: hypothetical protein ABI618_13310 [Nitrospirota bacterium]
MATEANDPIEPWTAKRGLALVVSILKVWTSLAEAGRMHGLTMAEVEDWPDKLVLEAQAALPSCSKDEEALREEQIMMRKQKVVDLVLDNDLLGGHETLAFNPKNIRRVRTTVSGVSERGGCRAWGSACEDAPSGAEPEEEDPNRGAQDRGVTAVYPY